MQIIPLIQLPYRWPLIVDHLSHLWLGNMTWSIPSHTIPYHTIQLSATMFLERSLKMFTTWRKTRDVSFHLCPFLGQIPPISWPISPCPCGGISRSSHVFLLTVYSFDFQSCWESSSMSNHVETCYQSSVFLKSRGSCPGEIPGIVLSHRGGSINGGTPKWMVYNGKSHQNGW